LRDLRRIGGGEGGSPDEIFSAVQILRCEGDRCDLRQEPQVDTVADAGGIAALKLYLAQQIGVKIRRLGQRGKLSCRIYDGINGGVPQ
jgi:hypothetical protein